jgi:hypothetical protein
MTAPSLTQEEMIIPPEVEAQGEDLINNYKMVNGDPDTVWKLASEVEEKTEEKTEEVVEEKAEETTEEKKDDVVEDKTEEVTTTEAPDITKLAEEKKEETTTSTYDFTKLGFQSEDEVKTALTQKAELEAEKQRLQAEIEAIKAKNPFEGQDDLAKLYGLIKKNPEEGDFYKQLMFGNPDPMEILVADYIKKNPSRKDDLDTVRELIQSRYSDLYSGDYEKDDKEYKLAKFRMEDDANSAKNSYLSELDKIEIPKTQTKEELESMKAESQKVWEPIVKQAFNQDIAYPIMKAGEKEAFYTHTFSKEEVAKLAPIAVAQLVNSGAELTQENFNKVYSSVLSFHTQQKLPEIMEAYGNKKVETALAEQKKEYDLVSKTEKNKDTQPKGKQNEEDEQDRAIANQPKHDPNRSF